MTTANSDPGDAATSTDDDDIVVYLRTWGNTSRYRRQSGALPRLSDDPTYQPATSLPRPVNDRASLWVRIMERLGR